jgi:hypothetical protein
MANPDLGLFLLKNDPAKMKFKNVKEFMAFCQDIIGRLESSEDKKIDTLFLPCFKHQKKNIEMPWMKGYCFGKMNLSQETLYVQEAISTINCQFVPQKPHEGSLSFDPTPNSLVIEDSFILIMTHQSMEENIKTPIFICLV